MENGALRTHVAWHRNLYHVQLGEYEEALTQFDDVIMPWVREGTYVGFVTSSTKLYWKIRPWFEIFLC